jgi:hypothetical protein
MRQMKPLTFNTVKASSTTRDTRQQNTRQTTVALDILDGAYHALYRRYKPTLTR